LLLSLLILYEIDEVLSEVFNGCDNTFSLDNNDDDCTICNDDDIDNDTGVVDNIDSFNTFLLFDVDK
jgi:hypothetical protein